MANKEIGIIVRAIDSVTAPMQKMADSVKGFGHEINTLVTGAVAYLVGSSLIGFFEKTVAAGEEAQKSIGRLTAGLATLGISYKDVADQIEPVFDAIQKTTRYSDEDAREAFTRLTTKTGDYNQSLKDLTTVADVASFKQISMSEAADLVAKAHFGGAKLAKEFNIQIEKGEDFVGKLGAKLTGFALQDSKTFEGAMARTKNLWEENLERVGLAIIKNKDVGDSIGQLGDGLVKLADWISKNSDEISTYVTGAVEFGKAIGSVLVGVMSFVTGFGRAMAGVWISIEDGLSWLNLKFQEGFGAIGATIGGWLVGAKDVLRKFGIDLGAGVADAMVKNGRQMVNQAKADLALLATEHKIGMDKLTATVKKGEDDKTAVTKDGRKKRGLEYGIEKADHTDLANAQVKNDKTIADAHDALSKITAALRSEDASLIDNARKGLDKLREEMILAGGAVAGVDGLLGPLYAKLKALEDRKPAAPLLDAKQAAKDLKTEIENSIQPSDALDRKLQNVADNTKDVLGNFQDIPFSASAQEVGKIATSALDAATQFGLISGSAHDALGSVLAMAQSLGNLKLTANGNLDIGSLVSNLPGIVGALGGFIGSIINSGDESRRILRENTAAVRALTEVDGDLVDAKSSGKTISKLAGLTIPSLSVAGIGVSNPHPGSEEVAGWARSQGLTLSQLDQAAKDLGITIKNNDGNYLRAGLGKLFGAAKAVDTAAKPDFDSKSKNISEQIGAGILTSGDEFGALVNATGGGNAITGSLSDLDSSSPIFRATATSRLQQLFKDLTSGKIKPAQFGGLSRSQFHDLLLRLLTILNSGQNITGLDFSIPTNDQPGGGTGGIVPDVPNDGGLSTPVIAPSLDISLGTNLDKVLGTGSPAVDLLAQIQANTGTLVSAFGGAGSPTAAPPITIDASIDLVVSGGTVDAATLATMQASLQTAQDRQIKAIEQALARNYDLYRAGAGNATRAAA